MSYDLKVSFKSWPADGQTRWLTEMRNLGITVEVPDDALAKSGSVAMKLTVEPGATIPWADLFRARGTFDGTFDLTVAKTKFGLTVPEGEGTVGAIWTAVAMAAVAKGTLEDPQAGVSAKGSRGIDILAKLMKNEMFAGSFRGPRDMDALPTLEKFAAPLPEVDVEIDADKPILDYSASTLFEVGDQVKHPAFGTGLVEATDLGKVTIAFRSGRRVLAQSKAGNSLARPNRIDHSLPTPGSKPSK